MSKGFHSEEELRKMEQHPSVQAIRIGRTKPYDCSYPVMLEKPRIAANGWSGFNQKQKKQKVRCK